MVWETERLEAKKRPRGSSEKIRPLCGLVFVGGSLFGFIFPDLLNLNNRGSVPISKGNMKTDQIRTGGWIQTFSGNKFYPLDPRTEEINLADIAHALSMICRYNGHTNHFYSVAEHSVLVSQCVYPENAFLALMHDASEAYISDLTTPVKRFIDEYQEIELNLEKAVRLRFGLPETLSDYQTRDIKTIDKAIVVDECLALLNEPPELWFNPQKKLNIKIRGWYPSKAEEQFLSRFDELNQNKVTY